MRIDLIFYRDHIKRVLKITSRRLRQMLKMPRSTELSEIKRPVDLPRLLIDARAELDQVTAKLPRMARKQSLATVQARTVSAGSESDTGQASVRPSMDRKKVEVTGKLVKFGKDRRDMHGNWIEQFFVDVASEDLNGRITRLWGADLHRAINEAYAQVGDRITVQQIGKVPCIIPEETTDADGTKRKQQRTSQKNVYVVINLTPKAKENFHAQGH